MNKTTPLIIYAESTPNPNAMMFVANRNLVEPGITLEFEHVSQTGPSPLAAELFKFPFVSGVFITRNFVTIAKNDSTDWNALILELREFLKEFIGQDGMVYNGQPLPDEDQDQPGNGQQEHVSHREPVTDEEKKIVEVLEEYVRPAVEGDGGAIHFHEFSNGVVTVKLRGACSGCPSSTITLKSGIEALLKRMVPGVEEVVAESY